MSVTLAGVKDYLRIDGSAEDALLQSFMAAAGAYLAGAIDDYATKYTDADFAALADMLMLAYIAEAYRNRDTLNDTRGAEKHFSYMFFAQITALQNWAVSS